MCINCVSNVDAIATNLTAGVIFGVNSWERASDRRRGISRLERAQRTWIRNRAFMIELGLDPLAVLGPAPCAPIAEGTPEDIRTAREDERVLTDMM